MTNRIHRKHFQSEQYKVAEKLTTGEIKELIAHEQRVNSRDNNLWRHCMRAKLLMAVPLLDNCLRSHAFKGERRFSWL